MTSLIISIAVTVIYLLSWIQFQKYQFLERDYNKVVKNQEYSKKWHYWKGLNQLIFFAVVFLFASWKITLVCMAFYWIGFDAFFNKIVLKRDFFFVGTTSTIDKTLQAISKKLHISSTTFSAILKIGLLAISVILLF
jgi:hypothetical protein